MNDFIGELVEKAKEKRKKYRKLIVIGGFLFLYLCGFLAQIPMNQNKGEIGAMKFPTFFPTDVLTALFSSYGLQAIIGLTLLLLGIVALWLVHKSERGGQKYDKERKFWYSTKGTYGTAGWMDEKRIQECFDVVLEAKATEVDAMIYGDYSGKLICRKKDTMLNSHEMIFGASGTMKSRAYARNKIISCAKGGQSIVTPDPKGELYESTAQYLMDHGYTVKVLNLIHPDKSDRFDGLDGAWNNPLTVATIVDAIISNTGGIMSDPAFEASESNLLSALIHYQLENETGEYASLGNAYNMLMDTDSIDELDSLFRSKEKTYSQRAYNLFSKASPNLKGNVINGLGSRLALLQNPEIAELMSYPDLDFTLPGKEKCAYFIIMSDQDSSMKFAASLFFTLLFQRLVRYADDECVGKRLPIEVTLIMEEFCNLVGAINSLHIKLSTVRSRGINISLIAQSLGQLENRYPNNTWSELLSNCDTMLFLGCGNDPITGKFISDRSGEVSIEVDTVMKQKNIFNPIELHPTYRQSEGVGRRMLLTIDEVMRMPPEQMLLILRGEQVLKLTKFDYTRNPESRKFRPLVETPIPKRMQVPSIAGKEVSIVQERSLSGPSRKAIETGKVEL